MTSINSVWIPTVATSYLLAFAFLLYAWEHLFGTVSGLLRSIGKKNVQKGRKTPEVINIEAPRRPKKALFQKGQTQQDVTIDLDRSTFVPVELNWEDLTCVVPTGDAKGTKTVLRKSTGTFLHGEFVAIVGPSGAGKSTMLDVLAGRKFGKGVEGVITLNDQVMTRELSNRCISYVGQEDVFMPTLSAWESLLFVSQLCMASASTAERHARMDTVLDRMGLLKVKHSKVGGALPGGLAVRGMSGGEQRRLSIACGLVGNPSILFLDEPTTGLDAHSALAVMSYLRTLSGEGHTIVSTIHQPRQEIFASFDKLLVLSEGYLLYLAPPSYAVRWFSEVLKYPYERARDSTESDWLLSIVAVGFQKSTEEKARQMTSLDEVRAAAERFTGFLGQMKAASSKAGSSRSSSNSGSFSSESGRIKRKASTAQSLRKSATPSPGWLTSEPSQMGSQRPLVPGSALQTQDLPDIPAELHLQDGALYARGWIVQFAVLWKRSFLYQLRNPAIAANRLLTSNMVGLIVGLCWIRIPNDSSSGQERLSMLFFAIMLFCLTPFGWQAFALAEKRFFVLDSAKGLYSPSAYFVSYVLSNLPFLIIQSCASTFSLYGLVGLRHETKAIFKVGAIMSLHSVIATQMVTGCIWFFNGQDIAFSIASLYVSFSLLISGFYIRVSDMTLSVARGLSWASFNKYSFQALARTELQDRSWPSTTCVRETDPNFQPGNILCRGTSNQLLEYYDYKLSVPQAVAAMLGYWGLFCLFSYWALLRLCKRR